MSGGGDPERNRQRARDWYAANTERGRANSRAAKQRNPEKYKAADRARYQEKREARLAYAALPENRAKKAARMKVARARDPEGSRLKFRAWQYSLTVDGLQTVLAAGCAVCGSGENLHIDHDHGCCPTGKKGPRSCGRCVRGALCHRCNTALGLLQEDPDRARALAAYMERQT